MTNNVTFSTITLLCLSLPLMASQATTTQQSQSHAFSQTAIISTVMGIEGMSTAVNEYLIYSNYACFKHVSKAWRAMISKALANENNPLLLPASNKLVAFTNKLFTNVPDNDPACLSVINTLKTLALRSHNAGTIFFNTFCQYEIDIPNEPIFRLPSGWLQQVLDQHANMHPQIKEFELAEQRRYEILYRDIPEAETPHGKQRISILNNLKPLLQQWQPYGIFFKLAQLYQLPGLPKIASPKALNLLEAPQICALHPLVYMDKLFIDHKLFSDSKRCYIQVRHDLEDQDIESYQSSIKKSKEHLANLENQPDSYECLLALEGLNFYKQCLRTSLVHSAKNAYADEDNDQEARKTYVKRAIKLLSTLDEIPPTAYLMTAEIFRAAAAAFSDHANEYHGKAVECHAKEAKKLYADPHECSLYARSFSAGYSAGYRLRISLVPATDGTIIHAKMYAMDSVGGHALLHEDSTPIYEQLTAITDVQQDPNDPFTFAIFADNKKVCIVETKGAIHLLPNWLWLVDPTNESTYLIGPQS